MCSRLHSMSFWRVGKQGAYSEDQEALESPTSVDDIRELLSVDDQRRRKDRICRFMPVSPGTVFGFHLAADTPLRQADAPNSRSNLWITREILRLS